VTLTLAVLVVGSAATFLFGLSKTLVPSVGTLGVALLATVLPALPSTGVALPVLLVGDLIAVSLYGRHAELRLLLRLVASVLVGLVAGFLVVRVVDTHTAGRLIGVVLLLSAVGEIGRRWWVGRRAPAEPPSEVAPGNTGGPVGFALGAGAGVSTMVANAGGPMMTFYLLRARVTTLTFLATVAWFFLAVNLLKVPFSVGLGLITPSSLAISAALVPGMVLGTAVGALLVRRISQVRFEVLALVATGVAGLWLALG
jgi:hypothetical protein